MPHLRLRPASHARPLPGMRDGGSRRWRVGCRCAATRALESPVMGERVSTVAARLRRRLFNLATLLSLLLCAVLVVALATVHPISPHARTLTAIGETAYRIDIFVGGGDNKPPARLDMLP